MEYDVLVIGAGVIGCAIARELSRHRRADGGALKIGVLEKEPDVSLGTSSRNSAVLHSGINYAPGTLRAKVNVLGNAMMDDLCARLKVPIKRIGKLTVALTENDLPGLHKQKNQGEANGVPGMELMDNAKMRTVQPGIEGILGLWTPTSAIISSFGLTIALAENACANGTDFRLNSEVTAIERGDGVLTVTAEGKGKRQKFTARVVITAAGLHCDEVCAMAGFTGAKIWSCRGEYYVLDKRLDGTLKTLIYPVPGPNDPGLGIHLTPTVDGNILIGPSAAYIPEEDREDYRATSAIMADLRREGLRLLPELAASDFIRSFSGNRPKQTPPEKGGNADFAIEDVSAKIGTNAGFIHLLGIESPGLTSAPAIANIVREMVEKHIPLAERDDFVAERPGFAGSFSELPKEQRIDLIKTDPEYGEIVCRCEQITKKEIRQAIENPLGARTMASVKYRARAQMGRCQGGFCMPRIVRMLRDEYGFKPEDYFIRGKAPMFFGNVRDNGKGGEAL
ncbi:MAG: NAD(P)/FAD-dependent oxidoreductase [Synergistaceae bacterium]|jgi:glycerol-3-phosphate dehydrogenase|nr:NAD(P)/FAD-dependent oxidoreductase [Synergistaceae bacterium]